MSEKEKKERASYWIAERCGTESRTLDSYEKAKELQATIAKYNSKKQNPFMCSKGKITINDDGTVTVDFIKYKKLIKDSQTLKDIDTFTTQFTSDKGVKESYAHVMQDTRHQVQIIHRQKGDVATKPMLFYNDKQYITPKSIQQMLFDKSKQGEFDQRFFVDLCYDKTFCSDPSMISTLDYLETAASRASWAEAPLVIMYNPTLSFYERWVGEENPNYLRMRTLGLYMKKHPTKTKVNAETYEQLKLSLETPSSHQQSDK